MPPRQRNTEVVENKVEPEFDFHLKVIMQSGSDFDFWCSEFNFLKDEKQTTLTWENTDDLREPYLARFPGLADIDAIVVLEKKARVKK